MTASELVKRHFLRGDRLIVTLITATLLFYLNEASSLERSNMGDIVGPSGFPILIAVCGLILCAIFYVNVFRGVMAEYEPSEGFVQEMKGITVLFMVIAYVILIDFIGYEAATFIFVAVTVKYLGEESWWVPALVAGVLTGFCHWFFVWFLEIRFQTGDFLLMLQGV